MIVCWRRRVDTNRIPDREFKAWNFKMNVKGAQRISHIFNAILLSGQVKGNEKVAFDCFSSSGTMLLNRSLSSNACGHA